MRPRICSDEARKIAFGFSPPDDPDFATRLRDGLGERGRTAVEGDGVGFATESYAASALYTTLASLSGALWRIRRARAV
jgi:hypothetical protein